MEDIDPDLNLSFEPVIQNVKWKALTITHVEYPKDDNLGFVLAISSLLPVFLIVSFITLILFRRDLHTIFFFVGVLLCEGTNVILKNIIAQPRPLLRETLYTEYGMPSSHSQLSWFFTAYCILFLLLRLRHNHGCWVEIAWKFLVITGVTTAALLVTYSRVYLLYHSWQQVIWGSLIGIVFGCVWFAAVHVVLTPFFPLVASWSICEFLMIRDTSLIPNVLWFEYTQARAENRTRNRKLVSMKSQ